VVHKQAQFYDGRQCFVLCFRARLLFRRGVRGGSNYDRLRDYYFQFIRNQILESSSRTNVADRELNPAPVAKRGLIVG
jgi:hypothetical protein